MAETQKRISPYPNFERYTWILIGVWTVLLTISLIWNIYQTKRMTLEEAYIQAKISFDKDVLFRRWNAIHGGVYANITEETPPNTYLSDLPERDLKTPSGRSLTLINPAYMTRQVYELQEKESKVRGHITSLRPVRPENTPDPWEKKALESFEQGQTEASSIQKIEGKEYMRLMRPLVTEKSCLGCHATHGYREGEIRGGISTSVPMEPLWNIMKSRIQTLSVTHIFLWVIGLVAIFVGMGHLKRNDLKRRMVEEEREKLVNELQESLTKVKKLSGLLPICSSCKKIRDDKGYWNQVESYIRNYSEVEFTHGICPDCLRKLYPDFVDE